MIRAIRLCMTVAMISAVPVLSALSADEHAAPDAAVTATAPAPASSAVEGAAPAEAPVGHGDTIAPAIDAMDSGIVGHAGQHEGQAAHGDAHHASAGLPQMDVTWFPSQVFWLAVMFVFLYVIFSKKVLPDISGTLENRRNQIQGDIDSAQGLKDEAEKVQHSYEQSLEESRSKATEIFATIDEQMKRKVAKKMDSFAATSQKKIAETEKAIEEAKAEAMGEMQHVAAEIASMAAEKIIGVAMDIDQAKTLVRNIGKKAA